MTINPTRTENYSSIQRIGNFAYKGDGIAIDATSTSKAVAFPALTGNNTAFDFLISNSGLVDVFIALGRDSSIAAVIPVDGTPANGRRIPPGIIMALDKEDYTHIAAITASSTATIYVDQGTGS